MTWFVAILLAIAAFAIAVIAFRLPRMVWTSLAAALVFGLAGYTFQASPDITGAPKADSEEAYADEWQIVDSRKALIETRDESSSNHLLTADAFALRGRFAEAAGFLGNVVANNPADFEAWVALGNVLTEQADGVLTQASVYAYTQANALQPDNPAPSYFLGLSLIRQGRMMEARQVWRSALDRMDPADDSESRAFLADRVQRLEEMLTRAGALAPPEDGTAP